MKVVDRWQNLDGSWTGRLWSQEFIGSLEQVLAWIRSNGELASVQCEFCDRSFGSIAGLRSHCVQKHAADMDNWKPPVGEHCDCGQMACAYCGEDPAAYGWTP